MSYIFKKVLQKQPEFGLKLGHIWPFFLTKISTQKLPKHSLKIPLLVFYLLLNQRFLVPKKPQSSSQKVTRSDLKVSLFFGVRRNSINIFLRISENKRLDCPFYPQGEKSEYFCNRRRVSIFSPILNLPRKSPTPHLLGYLSFYSKSFLYFTFIAKTATS